MRRILPDYDQLTPSRRSLLRRQVQTLLLEGLEGRAVREVTENEGYVGRSFCTLVHALRSKDPSYTPGLLLLCTLSLQNNGPSEWAMLGSNQRPLPCEGKASIS